MQSQCLLFIYLSVFYGSVFYSTSCLCGWVLIRNKVIYIDISSKSYRNVMKLSHAFLSSPLLPSPNNRNFWQLFGPIVSPMQEEFWILAKAMIRYNLVFYSVSQQNSSYNKLKKISFPITNLNHVMSLQTPPWLLSFPQISYLPVVKTNNSGYFFDGWMLYLSLSPSLKSGHSCGLKISGGAGGELLLTTAMVDHTSHQNYSKISWIPTWKKSHPKQVRGPIRNHYLWSTCRLKALLINF